MKTAEKINEYADEVRERAMSAGLTELRCPACGEAATTYVPAKVAEIITHVLEAHGAKQSLMGVAYTTLASPYEMTARIGEEPAHA